MLTFLKKYWLVIIAVVLLGITLVWYFKVKKTTPIEAPKPTFALERTLPSQGTFETAFPGTAISFYFSLPVDSAKTSVSIAPATEFEVKTDSTGKTVSIRPIPAWKFGVGYKISLGVSSKDGQSLGPIEYAFTLKSPKTSPMTD